MAKSRTVINTEIRESIGGMVSDDNFSGLAHSIQKMAIENVRAVKELETGCMGKLLGTRMLNMSVYSAFILSVFILALILLSLVCYIFGCICGEFVLELLKMTLPVVTMSLGYMFGKKDSAD